MTARSVFVFVAVWLGCCGAAADSNSDPKIAYWLHCAGCHGLEGAGTPPEVPTLIDQPGLIEAMPGGREYLIRVPGVTQASLDDAQLAEVVNYMLIEFSSTTLGKDFQPYSAEEIGRARTMSLKDPLKHRQSVLSID